MSAVERLAAKLESPVELAMVEVPGHVRKIAGKLRKIHPYSYWRDAVTRRFDYDIRGEYVEARIRHNSHLNTSWTHASGGKWGRWNEDRAARHKEILDALWKEQFEGVPSEGKAVLTGGLMGSGKTTIINTVEHRFDPKKFGRVDADMVKERMAEFGMIPEVEGLAPLEAATLVHEESARIASDLADRAYAEKKNIIWDVSMVDSHTINSRMRKLRASGYDEIHGVFVDITPEIALERVRTRYKADMEKWLLKQGHGGRYVPTRLVLKNKDWSGKYKSSNRRIFEQEKDLFDYFEVWDTSGSKPVLVESGHNPKPRLRMGF